MFFCMRTFPMNKEAELFCARNNTNKSLLDVDKRGFLNDLACRGSIVDNSKKDSCCICAVIFAYT